MKTINKISFDKYYIPDYAVETLINGNISECISYLRGLLDYGKVGTLSLHDELIQIYERVPLRYSYIRDKVFK